MLSSLFFLAMVSVANADESSFTIVAERQPAPFEGVLLSVPAAAEVLTKYDEQQMKCDLEVEYQMDRAGTECKLDKDLLNARVDTLNKQYDEIVAQKDLEIAKYKEVVKKQSPQYKWLWFAGGVVLGGATYYGIQRTINVNNP
tara:strand:- start:288 stop:716 length:429 start_codon:yes stop_codon:yes gene_type:complete